jgi:hypothetical protein
MCTCSDELRKCFSCTYNIKMECVTCLSAKYQVKSRNAKGIYPLTSTHTNTDTLFRQAAVTWHYYVSDSKGTGLTSLRRVSCTVGNGGEGSVPLCSRDVGISPPSEDMHYLVLFHCYSLFLSLQKQIDKNELCWSSYVRGDRRGDAGLRTLLSVQMLADNSLDTSHLLRGKTALCLNLVE